MRPPEISSVRQREQSTRSNDRRRGPKRSARVQPARGAEPSTNGVTAEVCSLEELVEQRLEAYVAALKGHLPRDLYGLIMPQLERPLIRVAMKLAEGRQAVAANMLGIHRNTLRSRIRELGLEDDLESKPRR
jgi:two-component system nitrogen regulation response regulator GlnG